jgi:pre-mRNA-processing factor 39
MDKARETLTALHEQFNVTKPVIEVMALSCYVKYFNLPIYIFAFNCLCVQAIIHLESIFPCEKRIEFLDSLVGKFLTPDPSQGELSSLSDKEEISSIFLEVILAAFLLCLVIQGTCFFKSVGQGALETCCKIILYQNFFINL